MDELPPPFVTVPGLSNIRDIGGWTIHNLNSKHISQVRKSIVYRGPDTATITPEGLVKLKELGIRTIFDIRSKPQIMKAGGVKELEGIQRIWCPIFPEGEYSPEKASARYALYAGDGTEGIVEAFTEILIHGAAAFRTILLHISTIPPASLSTDNPAVPQNSAILIHCTTGNNRSGVFIGIILSFLNIQPEDVATEYALSDIGLKPTRDAVVARLMKSPVFAGAGGGGRARAERMVGARPESMLAMLEMVKQRWGSAERYLKEQCGMTAEELESVRGVLAPGCFERLEISKH